MDWLNRKRPSNQEVATAPTQTITLHIHCTPEEAKQVQESLAKLLTQIGMEEIRRFTVLMDSPVMKKAALDALYRNT